MDPRLQLAIENDDVDELHRLIVEQPKLLDRASKSPFPNTPLHVASADGKTEVAMEIATLKPSFTRKLNPEGYSPMHLALKHERYNTARALMTIDPKLIRVKGRCRITPLHYVTGKEGDEELELLAEFLSTCKSSIEDLTNRCETAVHIAVKNHNFRAVKVLLGWFRRANLIHILDKKDRDGNTALHIAAFEHQPEIIKLLTGCANVNAKNFQGKTALEILQENHHDDQDIAEWLRRRGRRQRYSPAISQSQFFSQELTVFEEWAQIFAISDEATRDVILVVCALIATTTYQAALTPPGGYWQDSSSNPPANSTVITANSSSISIGKPHQAGNIILNGFNLYVFAVLNSMTFLVSISTIWAIALPLYPQTRIVHISMVLLGFSYFYSLLIEFPNSNAVGQIGLLAFYVFWLIGMMEFPRYLLAKHKRVQNRRMSQRGAEASS